MDKEKNFAEKFWSKGKKKCGYWDKIAKAKIRSLRAIFQKIYQRKIKSRVVIDRHTLLDKIVPDRHCPFCHRYIPEDRDWIIKGIDASCRRSNCKLHVEVPPVESNITLINGFAVAGILDQMQVKRKDFIEVMGWTKGRQSQFEKSMCVRLNKDRFSKLQWFFEQHGIGMSGIIVSR